MNPHLARWGRNCAIALATGAALTATAAPAAAAEQVPAPPGGQCTSDGCLPFGSILRLFPDFTTVPFQQSGSFRFIPVEPILPGNNFRFIPVEPTAPSE
jgi:hypothetical protein